MLGLREQLEALRRSGLLRTEAPAPEAVGSASIGQVLAGVVRRSSGGAECFVREVRFPGEHRHGALALAAAHDGDGHWLWRLAARRPPPWQRPAEPDEASALDWRRTLFLDTETTGLTGGPGTYVFLVGVGFFEPGSPPQPAGCRPAFVVRQYFMPDYPHEPALLDQLADLLPRFDTLVTLNGKSFDVPLLRTRYLAARRPSPLERQQHLDAIYPARRLWRGRLASCALGSLERHVLGIVRQGDVGGWEIPGRYFRYLRERDARPLAPVLQHNLDDVLGLLALTSRLGLLLRDPLTANDPRDLVPLARLFESHGDPERAIACYEAAIGGGLPGHLVPLALRRLSQQYVRAGRWERALELWEGLVRHAPRREIWPYVELAKHYEHRARDVARASHYANRALEVAHWRASLGHLAADGDPMVSLRALRHRLLRLERKRAQATAKTGRGDVDDATPPGHAPPAAP